MKNGADVLDDCVNGIVRMRQSAACCCLSWSVTLRTSVLFLSCVILACFQSIADADPESADGKQFRVHPVKSEFQAGETQIRVLLPDRLDPSQEYRVLYVLPVEAGTESRYGDGLVEIQKKNLHNKFRLICVAPTFSTLPWYADHPTDKTLRQESYLLKTVIPFVEKKYPALPKAEGRLLLGFSKSGWGAFSLILRHPKTFGRAAAWDAPLMMEWPTKYGSTPIFGTEENFENYRIVNLLKLRAKEFQDEPRLFLSGYGNFREQHIAAHELMASLNIAHSYRDGPQRKHDWHSGWVEGAVGRLMRDGKATQDAAQP